MALNVVLGGMTGNLTAQQMLEVPLVGDCSSNCNAVNSTIIVCPSLSQIRITTISMTAN